MSSRHSQRPYSSDDDFFDSGTLPARTDTSVNSRNRESSGHDDYSENNDSDRNDFDRSNNRSPSPSPSPRHSTAEQSVSSSSKSTRSTLTPLSRSRQSSSMRSFTELHSSVKKNYSVHGNLRKKTAGSRASWKTPKYGETQPKRSPVVQLMLSSKQQEINDLLNKLTNTKQNLATAEKENKLLKKLQTRHDKAIRQFENTRKELPNYLSTNSEDQHTLKSQLRKTQETKRSLESRLNQNFEEMKKMEGVLSRLKKLVYDKSLGERSELSKQLIDTESDLENAQQKIKDLDKKIESKLSSYTKQLNSERQKHQQTLKRLRKMEMNYLETNSTLKERERALQKGNIYAFRNREVPENEKAIVPLTTSTPKLPLPAIPRSRSPKKASFKMEEDRMSSERNEKDEVSIVASKSKPTTKVFLTADFDSPISSPSNSFIIGSADSTVKRHESAKEEKENQFAKDLKKTEEEIKKLQASVEQKANLLAKLQEIDRTTPRNPETVKSTGFGEDMFDQNSNSQSQYGISILSKHPRNPTPPNVSKRVQKDKDGIFGEYSSSIQDSSQRLRRPVKTNSPPHDESDADEPLFDLSSGKNNKKPDLLTQLFGKNDVK